MKKITQSPLFYIGLFIRLLIIFFILPDPVSSWYLPFLDITTSSISLDPWSTWLSSGGIKEAFPYGYMMWFIFLPIISIFKFILIPIKFSYAFTLIGIDFLLLILMNKFIENKSKQLLALYWLSPIVIFGTYFLGYNDIIPVFFLILALFLLKNHRYFLSGFILIAAVSAKLSMLISLPFFLIYFLHNKSLFKYIHQFIYGIISSFIIFIVPFIFFSTSGMNMLTSNPEMKKIYEISLSFEENKAIYIVPFIYFLIMYSSWHIKRLNFQLFLSILGLAFMLVIFMTSASPGWFIWIIPFLVIYQVSSDIFSILICSVFSFIYAFHFYLFQYLNSIFILNDKFLPLSYTLLIAIGCILAFRILKDTVHNNDYFRLSRKPYLMGVAGDSGAGKDTFAESMKFLFGPNSVSNLSGDNYHLWDRQKPIWQVMTHLNPMANNASTGLA